MKVPTPQEVLAVLAQVGSTIKITKFEHQTCHTFVDLANGWQLCIFDECECSFDYLEYIRIDNRMEQHYNFWEPPFEDDLAWDPVRYWEPTRDQLILMGLNV